MASGNVKLRVVLLLVLLFVSCFYANMGSALGVSEGEAREAVNNAQSAVLSGYTAVSDAEKAGANVSNLLVTLNEAGDLLSRANLALVKRENDTAFAYASQSQQLLNGFNSEAAVLKDAAVRKGFSDFMIYIVGSILGAVFVILGSVVLWVVLKRKYPGTGSIQDGS